MPAVPDFYFASIPQGARSSKPRTVGRTMVIDWGIGLRRQADLTDTAAAFFEFAKVAVGIGGMLAGEIVRKKIDAYHAADVEPYPGGQYLEHAEINGVTDAYLPAVVEAGYRWMEVSDNLAPVSLDWKSRMIREAVDKHGLNVFGEVGKKEGLEGAPLVDDAKACLDAGASIILLEAAELVSDDPAVARDVEAVVDAVGLERVMFELPGPWIAGVHACDIHAMRRQLLDQYGPEVNLGNVSPDEIVSTEALRRRLGVNAGGVDE